MQAKRSVKKAEEGLCMVRVACNKKTIKERFCNVLDTCHISISRRSILQGASHLQSKDNENYSTMSKHMLLTKQQRKDPTRCKNMQCKNGKKLIMVSNNGKNQKQNSSTREP